MNKKQKFQAALAALIVVYIIVLLFFPGWKASKILGIFACVCTLIAIYVAYKAEVQAEEKRQSDKATKGGF